MTELLKKAQQIGFSHVGILDPGTIELRQDVRKMCRDNACGRYDTCWSCPPGCGELPQLREKLAAYDRGILVQTTAELEDEFDMETMMAAEKTHRQHFEAMHRFLRGQGRQVLALGAGCCTRCEKCTYPNAPCRFPEEMTVSMEACGILVLQVCRDNGMEYYYGKGTLTYTSCYLLKGECV